jgi:CheY-like chemotaxis protein
VVESREGASTLLGVLPPEARIAMAAPEPPAVEAQRKRRARVLVVDDEPALCSVVERILGVDHDVTVVTAARQAFQLIERGERFDVILSDLMMPQMNGIELEAALRRVAPDQADRMVFMTGGTSSHEAAAFLAKWSKPTIDKPFRSAALRGIVQSLLDKADPAD